MSEPTPRRWRIWGRRAFLGFCAFLIIVMSLLALGSFLPDITWIGVLGSLGLTLWPAWFIVLPLGATLVFWRFSRNRIRPLLAALALLTMIGAGVVIHRVVSVAHANKATVTIGNSFGFSDSIHDVAPDEVVTYLKDQGDDLTLRIFKPRGKAPASGWPVFMNIHGGGWVEGSNKEQSADMRWFADQGYVVISVGYSLSTSKRHLWDRVMPQLGCAMAWTKKNIAARSGDVTRLSLRGGSAGGNLSLNAAYMANAETLTSACGGTVPRVEAVIPIYPGVDLVPIYNNSYVPNGADVRSMVTRYLGGSPAQYPQRYRATGSATHITTAAPPTLIFITENDHLVPLASMESFAEQVRKAGVPVHTVTIPHGEHGFDLVGMGNAMVRQISLDFLRKHGRTALTAPVAPTGSVAVD